MIIGLRIFSLVIVQSSGFQAGPPYPVGAIRTAPTIAALRALAPLCSHVVVLLRHSYAQEELLDPKVLKGCDRHLYDTVSGMRRCELLPVVTRWVYAVTF